MIQQLGTASARAPLTYAVCGAIMPQTMFRKLRFGRVPSSFTMGPVCSTTCRNAAAARKRA
jgi:hypothetical protein